MTEQELDAILAEIKGEGLNEIDSEPDYVMMGTGYELSLDAPEGMTIANVRGNALAARRRKAKQWWSDFMTQLKEWVRNTLCCRGIPLVDTPEERALLVEKFLAGVLLVVPQWVVALIRAFEDKVRRALEAIFAYLVGLASGLCDNVSCTLAPIPVEA